MPGEGLWPVVSLGLYQLNQLLLTLTAQNAAIQSYVERLSLRIVNSPAEADSFDPSTADTNPYELELRQVTELPAQIFRERGFPLSLQLVAQDNSPRSIPNLKFKLGLYTMETPPRRLLRNITGKKALRGSLEAESASSGLVSFSNIVINEVSSHYLGDGFYLCIVPASHLAIRPFVLRDVTVKARKPIKRQFKSS